MAYTEDDAIARAAQRAWENKGDCFSVYKDGEDWVVQASEAVPPKNAKLHCIAQFWADRTVQVRFSGAHSQWQNF